MKKDEGILFHLCIFLIVVFLLPGAGSADEETEALKKQVEVLNQRVVELERALQEKSRINPSTPSTPDQPSDRWRAGPSSSNEWFDHWDPFAELDRMQEEMDQMFPQGFGSQGNLGPSFGMGFSTHDFSTPDIKVLEEGNNYVIRFDLSGFNEQKVDIEVNEHSITLSGERSQVTEETHPQGKSRSQSFESYTKVVPLPMDADVQKMETKKEDQQLLITIPKK